MQNVLCIIYDLPFTLKDIHVGNFSDFTETQWRETERPRVVNSAI